MHSTFSVIFFTVTSGAGYGVLILLGLLGIINTELFFNEAVKQSFAIIGFGGIRTYGI